MLLLFWSGIQDGVGAATGQGAGVGVGHASLPGQGSVAGQAVLLGSGAWLAQGEGIIVAVAALTGDGAGIVPAIDYFWFGVSPGGVAYRVPPTDGLGIAYNTDDDPASISYQHQSPTRRLS